MGRKALRAEREREREHKPRGGETDMEVSMGAP